jgi:hypothetical protein
MLVVLIQSTRKKYSETGRVICYYTVVKQVPS